MYKLYKNVFIICLSFMMPLLFYNYLNIKADNNYSVEISSKKQQKNFFKLLNKYNVKYKDSIKKVGLYRLNIKNKFLLKKIKSFNNIKVDNKDSILRIHKSNLQNKNYGSSLFKYQWDMRQITDNGNSYKLLPKSSNKNDVALIDSGIDFNNPALIASNNNNNRNFVPLGGVNGKEKDENGNKSSYTDYFGHGTNVAGQIGGDGPVFGTFPGLKIRSYRVFDENGNSNLYWIIKAIISAAKDHEHIINLSLGKYVDTSNIGSADVLGYKKAVKYAQSKGSLVVAALGNDGVNESKTDAMSSAYFKYHHNEPKGNVMDYPAQINGVIMAGSSNRQEKISNFSNYNKSSENNLFYSPGGDEEDLDKLGPKTFYANKIFMNDFILTTMNNNNYSYVDGTSLSAGKISGILAAIIEEHKLYLRCYLATNILQNSINKEVSSIPLVNEYNALSYDKQNF